MNRPTALKNFLIVLALAASIALLTRIPSKTNPEAEWKEAFDAGETAILAENYEQAEFHIQKAINLAKEFPAQDERLYESLDDMGLVYFQQGRFADASKIQGQAIAALVLSQGPNAEELDVYIDRYQWALKETGMEPLGMPDRRESEQYLQFLVNNTYPKERARTELQRLNDLYSDKNNEVGVRQVEELLELL